MDYDLSAVIYCNDNFATDNNSFLNSNALFLSIGTDVFDIAITFQVIEHISNSLKFINELKRVVKPSGLIIISTPNVADSIKGKYGNPFHINEMGYRDLDDLLRKSFEFFEILGHTYKSQGILMKMIRKLPLYKIGAKFKRSSIIKREVSSFLGMTEFRTVRDNIENSMDLYAVCKNE